MGGLLVLLLLPSGFASPSKSRLLPAPTGIDPALCERIIGLSVRVNGDFLQDEEKG
jgi:hypothetical protein